MGLNNLCNQTSCLQSRLQLSDYGEGGGIKKLASKLAAESVVAIDEFVRQLLAKIGRFAFGPPENHHVHCGNTGACDQYGSRLVEEAASRSSGFEPDRQL